MTEITVAKLEDLDNVVNFYKKVGYKGETEKDDIIIIAKDKEKIIGVVRISTENNIKILRGMQIDEAYQRKRIGSEMLKKISEVLSDETCYCLPLKHLEKFYNQIDFKKIENSSAPIFLQKRLEEYIKKYNYDLIVMKK